MLTGREVTVVEPPRERTTEVAQLAKREKNSARERAALHYRGKVPRLFKKLEK